MKESTVRKTEIGSEFWDVPIGNRENSIFPDSTQWYLSGRSALQAIIKELRDCQAIAMPSWCCESMVKPFVNAGIRVDFYPVYFQDGLIQELNLECDALFLMDYFGYSGTQPELSDYSGVVIRDVTHSLFSKKYSDADYYFGSLRKWCGVWTGGYAWTRDGHNLAMDYQDDAGYTLFREKAMGLKNSYIHGYMDSDNRGVNDKAYLNIFDEAENALDHIGIVPASDRDIFIANRLDADFMITRRRANAKVLRKALCEWLIFLQIGENDCPMFVPVIVPDGKRDELRGYLIEHEIYCPVHWPVCDFHNLAEQEKYIYENELSLVCDQRYTEEDMNRIVQVIECFWRKDNAHSF